MSSAQRSSGISHDPSTIPARVPYLAAEPDLVEAWRQRLPSTGTRVGIAWQGNPGARADRRRSASLEHFLGLARCAGVRLVSLQKNEGVEQLAGVPSDVVQNLGDVLDTGRMRSWIRRR